MGAASRQNRSGKSPKVATIKKFRMKKKKKVAEAGKGIEERLSYTFSIIIDFPTIDNRYKSILDPLPLPPIYLNLRCGVNGGQLNRVDRNRNSHYDSTRIFGRCCMVNECSDR